MLSLAHNLLIVVKTRKDLPKNIMVRMSKKRLKKRSTIDVPTLIIIICFAVTFVVMSSGVFFYHGTYGDVKLSANSTAVVGVHQAAHAWHLHMKKPDANLFNERKLLHPNESPMLVIAYNRGEYLKETLEDIYNHIPRDCSLACPLIISQDGKDHQVTRVIQKYTKKFAKINIPFVHLEHKGRLRGDTRNAYVALAEHYGWALHQVFEGYATGRGTVLPQRLIILEEDLHIAPDFFGYFLAMAPLLDADPSLLAISAFNDNGFDGKVNDPYRILRSDFFPGLGWMLNRRLWDDELADKWPSEKGYWDDWLRDPAQRQGRQVLRPEVSRTFHFGTKGTSNNQFGASLSKVKLNDEKINWRLEEFAYLYPSNYDASYFETVQAAEEVESVGEALQKVDEKDTRLVYESFAEFQRYARQLELMDDEKAGVPRTSYKGIVETRPKGENFLFLTPPLADLRFRFGFFNSTTE